MSRKVDLWSLSQEFSFHPRQRSLGNEKGLTFVFSFIFCFVFALFFFVEINKNGDSLALSRYDEDIKDRTWVPYIDKNNSVIRTDVAVDTSNFYNVPQVVARTAAIPVDESQPLTIDWTLDEVTAQSYIYMHFAEIQNLKANETREFNITYNGGKRWFDYFRPPNFSITTIFNPRAVSSPDGKFNFTFSMTSNSTLPPLINALEIYKVLDLSLLETNQDEGKLSMFSKLISLCVF